ncbi:MAG: DUF3800 domain-containing protein [Armatimonadota bacterium]
MLFFVDESGHPHPNDNTHRPVLGAVGIGIGDIRQLIQRTHALKRDVLEDEELAHECKYKANAILNQRTFERERRKWEYVEGLFELAVNFPVESCFVVMQKPSVPVLTREGRLATHLRCLLRHINAYMESERPDKKALIVFDGQDPGSDLVRATSIANFLFRHEAGRTWQRLVETPLFVDSRTQPGIQIADLFVSCMRQYYECKEGQVLRSQQYQRALGRLHRAVCATAHDYEDGDFTSYGVHFLNNWPEEDQPRPEQARALPLGENGGEG